MDNIYYQFINDKACVRIILMQMTLRDKQNEQIIGQIVPYSVEIKLTYHLLGNYDRSTDETVDGKAV